MQTDLEDKVAITLARFDEAVKQSSTRRQSKSIDTQQQEEQSPEGDLDLAERIAAEANGSRPLSADKGKPSCRPWDYEAFIERQRTFTPLNWFSKPAFASPPVCARYGWVNTGRDTLSCQCCNAQLIFSEDKQATAGSSSSGSNADSAGGNTQGDGDDNTDAANAGGSRSGGTNAVAAAQSPSSSSSSSSFMSRIKSQHYDLCPWNGNPCPKEFMQLPAMAVEDVLAEFLSRLIGLGPLMAAAALPEVSLPSSFEEYCPGGLSTLAAKTKAVLAQRASIASASSCPADASATPAAGSENGGSRHGPGGMGNKRQRDGGGCADSLAAAAGELSAFGDEVLGTAAAIAVLGWSSAAASASTSAGAGSTAVSSFPTERSSNALAARGDGQSGGGSGAGSPQRAAHRLCCVLCNRRVATDNFLSLKVGTRLNIASGSSAEPSSQVAGSGGSTDGSGGTKRRRLSGRGSWTPLKRMDLATEHRSFCPWAVVHPPVEGEEAIEGAVPGWVHSLEALLSFADGSGMGAEEEEEQASSKSKPKETEAEGFGDAATGKAKEALEKVQNVLGVLMRY